MNEQEVIGQKSMDKAIRPSAAVLSRKVSTSPRMRHPLEQAEIDRRVAIYTRQVEEHGRITWLPHKGEGQDK